MIDNKEKKVFHPDPDQLISVETEETTSKLLIQPIEAKLEAKEFKFYQSSAEGGNLLAHYYLGRHYETGCGIDRNLSHALYCFQAAIDYHPEAKAAYQRLQVSSPTIKTPASISTIEPDEFKKLSSLKELGVGGQGKLYQAEWNGEAVAIKNLFSPITEADVRRQIKHLTEAKTNQSNYLMQIKAVCSSPLSLILEYIPGKNLTDFLKENSDLSWLRRYRLAHDIIQGLAYLHQNSLLHRDLKSANIMVLEQPYIHTKLCDFESLKKIQANETGYTKQSASILYLDPEYLSESKSYAWYHDIYSLGRVLWEIATGEIQSVAHLHNGILYNKDNIPVMDTIPSDCPADFAKLIRDCLSPRDKRPHAAELAKRAMILLQSKQQDLVKQPDEKGRTPLINAISQGKIEKVATLLDCKASVHQTDSHGWKPLFWAGQKDNQPRGITKLLLEAKANPTMMKSEKPTSIIPKALSALSDFFKTKADYFTDEIRQGNFIKVKYFVEIEGLKPSYFHLTIAVHNRYEDISIYLFEKICDEMPLGKYLTGRLIAAAIELNLTNFIKFLMQKNLFLHEFPLFDPPKKSPYHENIKGLTVYDGKSWEGTETSLFLACSFGREAIVKLLLANPQIDINGKKIGFYREGRTTGAGDYEYVHHKWDITPAEAASNNVHTSILFLLFEHAEKYGKKIEMREKLEKLKEEPETCLIL